MKCIKLLSVVSILLLLYEKQMAQAGLYLTEDDFLHKKLSYSGDCKDYKIKLHELFSTGRVDIIYNGTKQQFSKDTLYGYHDCRNHDYRFYGHDVYQVIDTAGFYVYKITVRDQPLKGKGYTVITDKFYFSTSATGSLQPLTAINLIDSFPSNVKFHYALESYLNDDKKLAEYDDYSKCYKVTYLFRESLK